MIFKTRSHWFYFVNKATQNEFQLPRLLTFLKAKKSLIILKVKTYLSRVNSGARRVAVMAEDRPSTFDENMSLNDVSLSAVVFCSS